MKMPVLLCLIFYELVFGQQEIRKIQKPFVADAVGNTLSPPKGPSKVGSPSSLLTPDRYEFYTFDDSGELVKKLMTLDEIQAIVAADDGNDGHMVTFANDEPTILYNFSQPSNNKVHSVVTNVQNVLKSQMEAQKNNPPQKVPFDTPDVSNSWSLILPSIFGNTGIDIVPDKLASTFRTPDTDTIDILTRATVQPFKTANDLFSKEEIEPIVENTESNWKDLGTQSTTPTLLPSSIKANNQSSTGTTLILSQDSTTKEPSKLTTAKTNIIVQSMSTKNPLNFMTVNTNSQKLTESTSKTDITTTKPYSEGNLQKTHTNIDVKLSSPKPFTKPFTKAPQKTSIFPQTTEHTVLSLEKRSTISIPSNTITTEGSQDTMTKNSDSSLSNIQSTTIVYSTTSKTLTTKTNKDKNTTHGEVTTKPSLTTHAHLPSTIKVSDLKISPSKSDLEDTTKKSSSSINETTTLTTQSVSPSTTSSTTEMMSENDTLGNVEEHFTSNPNEDSLLLDVDPIFDVAQSFNQIVSDLGNQSPHVQNSSTQAAELKSNGDIDITESTTSIQNSDADVAEPNFIKISTIDPLEPQDSDKNSTTKISTSENNEVIQPNFNTNAKPSFDENAVDKVLENSMTDLMSQIADLLPPHAIIKTTVRVGGETPTTPMFQNDVTTIKSIQEDEDSTTTKNLEPINGTTSFSEITMNIDATNVSKENSLKINTSSSSPKEEVSSEISSSSPKPEIKTSASTEIFQYVRLSSIDPLLPKLEMTSSIPLVSSDFKKSTTIRSIPTESSNQKETTTKSIQDLENVKEPFTENSYNVHASIHQTEPNIYSEHTSEKNNKIDDIKKKIQKVNIDDKELVEQNSSWKLISTVAPPSEDLKDQFVNDLFNDPDKEIVLDNSKENQGLEATIKNMNDDVRQFTELCNELAFKYWQAASTHTDKKRSFVLSPYAITSMLAMLFMGARGATSGEMNEVLKLDDMVTFNPHFTLKNISDSIEISPESGVAVSAFVRELFSDRNNGKILSFYKERAQHFYNGHVEEVNFKLISDIIRRRTNLLVKRYTWGKIPEYIKSNSISISTPLAAFSVNVFQTDCTESSVEGRDGEMYFVVSPSVRQRRLVPVPSVVYKKRFLAGYDPILDATAASIGTTNSTVSVIFLMPGQQGNSYHAEDLEALEKRLLDSNPTIPIWNRLLRTLLPRAGLEIQIPRFSHKSIFNVSSTLKIMGLSELFNPTKADLGGLNGASKDLHLSDMIQMSTFVTCGEGLIGEQHHIEEYPDSLESSRRRRTSRWSNVWDEPRDYQRAFHDPHDLGAAIQLPLHLRPRQARLPARSTQSARLKFDRPFLFATRHNPTGMILYVGRYNPRLLP